MGSLEEEQKTTAPATSPSHSAEIQGIATFNLNNISLIQSHGTGAFSPEIQRTQSHSSLFATPRVNLDQQIAYPRWSQQHQLPNTEFPQALARTSYSAPNTHQISRPSYDLAQLNQFTYQTDSYDRNKFNSYYPETNAAVKSYQPSPPKKRKKEKDDDDCKRCNCKKTKCLKLYCECFSSGYYCAKSCSCQECYNTIEYEDTVQGSRELIEGDDNFSTPSSMKYRRGCNCKKTMCQKKYCECYQSNVGCANGCRCEGCENVYGKKRDYSKIKDILSKRSTHQISGVAFDKKLQMASTQDYLPQTELNNPYNLSSLISPIQFPYHQPASKPDFCSPYGNSPQYYQNFDNHPALQNSRNYSGSKNVPKTSDLLNADISDALLPQQGIIPNSFDPNNMFIDAPSSNYLSFLDSQSSHIPPFEFDEKFYSKNIYDKLGVYENYTPPEEVKAVASRNLRGTRNFQLPSVPLFPPLMPPDDPKNRSSSERKNDSEDSNIEKRQGE